VDGEDRRDRVMDEDPAVGEEQEPLGDGLAR